MGLAMLLEDLSGVLGRQVLPILTPQPKPIKPTRSKMSSYESAHFILMHDKNQ
jgi:hypothetical protein